MLTDSNLYTILRLKQRGEFYFSPIHPSQQQELPNNDLTIRSF